MLRKNPGFTAVALLTLALGVGSNAAVFSLVSALFLRPPAMVERPEQLVSICELKLKTGKPNYAGILYPDYLTYRDRSTVFSGLAAHFFGHLADGEAASEIEVGIVSDNYFTVLGVKPRLGRFFLPEENTVPGRNPVVVLSHDFWQRRFAADSACIGGNLTLNATLFSVIGIAPPGFRGTHPGESLDVWIPAMMGSVAYRDLNILSRQDADLDLVGRLKPGQTLEQARAEMTVLSSQLQESFPETNRNSGIYIAPLKGVHPALRSNEVRLPSLLTAVVLCLILVSCANLAGLLLVRSLARRKEVAVRLALGAGRTRLVRQFLTESLLLSVVGGTAGMVAAPWMMELLNSLYSVEVEGMTPHLDLGLDPFVVSFAILLTLLAGFAFGLAPALQASRPDLVTALKEDTSAFGYRRSMLRAGLLTGQVALALLLLTGAGLLIQSMRNLMRNPGFAPDHVLFIRMKPHLSGYDTAKSERYFQEVRRRLKTVNGVESITFAGFPPLRGWGWSPAVHRPGNEPAHPEDALHVYGNPVTRDFFETLKIALVKGRVFEDPDYQKDQAGVVVINEALADRLCSNQDALGQILMVAGKPHEVVGVVRYQNYQRSGEPAQPFLFRPGGGNRMMVRLKGDPKSFLPILRQEIMAVDPHVAISEELPLTDVIENFFMPVKMAGAVLSYTGFLALLLSAIGLYAMLAFAVGERTREIGIRMALGAVTTDVLKLIIRDGLKLVVVGVAVGWVASLTLTHFLSSYLYGVRRYDVLTFVFAAWLLVSVSLLACYIPARRATKVDPMRALRSE